MPRKKRIKFAENKENPCIVEPGKDSYTTIKGNRHKDFFQNTNPITLELACGKGEYTVQLAKLFPERNFVGVDIKGERIWRGAQWLAANNSTNWWFVRTIIHHITDFFDHNEAQEIRIVHPDPRPRKSDTKKRLTHPRFLQMYQEILQPGGILRLKTDDTDFFHYSVETLVENGWIIDAITFDLYESHLYKEHHGVKTHYEKLFVEQGRTIKYCRCHYQGTQANIDTTQ